jgi:ABC-type multidrug transport system permease subunit
MVASSILQLNSILTTLENSLFLVPLLRKSNLTFLVAVHMLGWFAGSGYGLFLSTIFPSLEIAMALVPILIIPFFVLAGFFVQQSSIPIWLIEFEYLSVFKWIFQALAIVNSNSLYW